MHPAIQSTAGNIFHRRIKSWTDAIKVIDWKTTSWYHIAIMHGHVIWMTLHNKGKWWLDTYDHEPAEQVIICIHKLMPELCNAIQITGQLPSRVYIIPSDVNVRRWLPWCFESRARAAIFHCCEVYKICERHYAQMKMKSWTATRVMIWLLCEHVKMASTGALMSHFVHMWVGMGRQALNFCSRANYVFKMSRMHACLKIVQLPVKYI